MRFKKIILIISSLVGIWISYLFYFGSVFGYLLGKYSGGDSVGSKGKIISIKFSVGKYIVHLHHWIFALLFLAIATFQGFLQSAPSLFWSTTGFFTGLIFQEVLCYRDWYRIIKKL